MRDEPERRKTVQPSVVRRPFAETHPDTPNELVISGPIIVPTEDAVVVMRAQLGRQVTIAGELNKVGRDYRIRADTNSALGDRAMTAPLYKGGSIYADAAARFRSTVDLGN